jgi:1-acyl-sn-glycerol-3-phosphate acyltransferase
MQLHLRHNFHFHPIAKISHLRRKLQKNLQKKLPQTFVVKNSSNRKKYQSSVSSWMSKILYPLGSYGILPMFFGKLNIIGLENIPLDCPVILAPTHRSRWDGILVAFATGKLTTGRNLHYNLHYMVSADELTGIQGWIIRKMGGFPVNTQCPKIGSFRHSVELLTENKMLVIFPEGDIFQDGKIHNLKNGLARIALEVEKKQPQSKIKIVPIVINYKEKIPTWGTDVEIKIGQALNVEEYQSETIKQSTHNLTQDLKQNLQQLSREITIKNPVKVDKNLIFY